MTIFNSENKAPKNRSSTTTAVDGLIKAMAQMAVFNPSLDGELSQIVDKTKELESSL